MCSYFLNSFIALIFISVSFSAYQVGDQISAEDQLRRHEVCYGADHHNIESDGHGGYSLSLGDFNGYTNESGIFYVIMIDMAASW